AADPLLPSCMLRQRDLFEPLEPRRMTDTPVGPALTLQYFTATDPTSAASTTAALTTTVSASQMGDLASAVGTLYDPTHPFHALFTGSFETADTSPTTYFF